MTQSHDQDFKNLILDYPVQSIQFFAPQEAKDIDHSVNIVPVRQEQLKNRLGDRFRALDTPIIVSWPDGRREAVAFVIEEESQPSQFSIQRLVCYCAELSSLLDTTRIVPVVIFLKPGAFPRSLKLGSDSHAFLWFQFIACNLGKWPVSDYMNSDNVVARLNLPLMCYNSADKVGIYANAMDGLVSLESRLDYQLKYGEFIDLHANLSTAEMDQYEAVYASTTEDKMGLLQRKHNEGIQQGMQQGMQQGIQQGEAAVLLYQIKRKFGQVPEEIKIRIQGADGETLLAWSGNLLSANTIGDVFH